MGLTSTPNVQSEGPGRQRLANQRRAREVPDNKEKVDVRKGFIVCRDVLIEKRLFFTTRPSNLMIYLRIIRTMTHVKDVATQR